MTADLFVLLDNSLKRLTRSDVMLGKSEHRSAGFPTSNYRIVIRLFAAPSRQISMVKC